MKTVGAFSENLYSSEEKTVGLHQLVGVALVLGIDGCVMIGKGKNKGSENGVSFMLPSNDVLITSDGA